jgi:hypothetical protein
MLNNCSKKAGYGQFLISLAAALRAKYFKENG